VDRKSQPPFSGSVCLNSKCTSGRLKLCDDRAPHSCFVVSRMGAISASESRRSTHSVGCYLHLSPASALLRQGCDLAALPRLSTSLTDVQ
jgi:hypothetical protein